MVIGCLGLSDINYLLCCQLTSNVSKTFVSMFCVQTVLARGKTLN